MHYFIKTKKSSKTFHSIKPNIHKGIKLRKWSGRKHILKLYLNYTVVYNNISLLYNRRWKKKTFLTQP